MSTETTNPAREACEHWRETSPDARMGDVERCRKNGWTVGTRLIGDEGWGATVIEITAIGESRILAKCLSHKGAPGDRREGSWTLDCRDWQRVW